ncbi:MAG: DUF1844 domain-containing protein [Deltaproteobacteria bacterium]|nr:DUF1844 domain-containing protein [Deltaproteobacteria bacterium]
MSSDDNDRSPDGEAAEFDQNLDAYNNAVSKQRKIPPIDFNTFILSLSTSALMQLGEVTDPENRSLVDVGLAQQTIDLIGLLEEKTRGNLTGEEERLLHQVLFDLRMCFVKKCKDK